MRPPHHISTATASIAFRRRAPAATPPVPGLQAKGLGPGPLVAVAAAAARITSLSDACQRSTGPLRRDRTQGADGDPARLRHLQRQLNAALAGPLPKALRRASSGWPST